MTTSRSPGRWAGSAASQLVLSIVVAILAGCAPAMLQPSSTPARTEPSPPTAVSASPASPSPVVFARDSVVVTLENRLRVRSKPGVEADSKLLEPLLPAGTTLFVLEGPLVASGYEWYRVVPIAPRDRTLPHGWVARSSHKGVPWLGAGTAECRAVPTSIQMLAALDPGTRLACFRDREINVQARIIPCNCDVDGGSLEPRWFDWGDQPLLLVGPNQTRPPADSKDWFVLHLDPDGDYPRPIPTGRVVTVTGTFDHPASSSCVMHTLPEPGTTEVVPDCRWTFAVTRIGA
jgi:hypothetical protein